MSIGAAIGELQDKIAASLWMKPATLEDLMKREFLHNIADFQIDRQLFFMERDKKVYMKRGGKYYTYKKFALELNRRGYELEVNE